MKFWGALGQSLMMLLRGLLTLAVMIGLAWGGVQLWKIWNNHEQGALIQIELLNPSQHVTQLDMQMLLRPYSNLGFWQLDLPVIRKLVETHPWVVKADVYRYWPNRLNIEVTEHIPIARWGENELINQHGNLFKVDKLTGLNDLIKLSSLTAKPKDMLIMLKDMLEVINPYGLHIRELVQLADGSWQIFLISGDEWYLPAKDAMLSLKRLLSLYGSIPEQENSKMRIDLRYRDGFAVKWLPKTNDTVLDGSIVR